MNEWRTNRERFVIGSRHLRELAEWSFQTIFRPCAGAPPAKEGRALPSGRTVALVSCDGRRSPRWTACSSTQASETGCPDRVKTKTRCLESRLYAVVFSRSFCCWWEEGSYSCSATPVPAWPHFPRFPLPG